ncbi:MAG: transporter substrate-binding domain-containing protein, partial [Ekhidna sp.]|nr:transporter substrate-binding domain-containing protein [Ekhidna sp.]
MLRLILAFFLVFSFVISNAALDEENELNLHWNTSKPFIYQNAEGELVGIEVEILEAFKSYMQEEEGVSIELNWIKSESFSMILETIKAAEDPRMVGVSAFSITKSRQKYAEFSYPYFPDAAVLISSAGTPIVRSIEEVYSMIEEMTAVTIENTSHEEFLIQLQDQISADFKVEYIDSEKNIHEEIQATTDRFGFIDLPMYMMWSEAGSGVTRQNFFTKLGDGYAYVLPKGSAWKSRLDNFLSSEAGEKAIDKILAKYLGDEVYQFVNNLSLKVELGTNLLTKEKEMQLEMLKNANLKLEQEQSVNRILAISIGVLILFVLAFGYVLYKNQKNASLLIGQKDQIEDQQEDIRQKNEQLMNRNSQLVALNEEKNNLVKILAHDIRSPLSQIVMIIDILNQNKGKEAEDSNLDLLGQAKASTERISDMVTKILDIDGLEESRVKVMQERVNIETIMQDISERYRPIAAKKDIELNVVRCKDYNIIRTDHLLLLL